MKGFTIIYLPIALVILGVIGGFLLLNKDFSSNNSISSVVSTQDSPPTTNITSSDEITNWKIYTSKDFYFSFSYPQNISFEDIEGGNGLVDDKIPHWIWLDKQIQIFVADYELFSNCQGICPTILSRKNIIMAGQDGKIIEGIHNAVHESDTPQKFQLVTVPYQNLIYHLFLWEVKRDVKDNKRIPKDIPEQEIKLFNKILSTFKFTQ